MFFPLPLNRGIMILVFHASGMRSDYIIALNKAQIAMFKELPPYITCSLSIASMHIYTDIVLLKLTAYLHVLTYIFYLYNILVTHIKWS